MDTRQLGSVLLARSLSAVLLGVVVLSSSQAAPAVTFNAVDRGWWSHVGESNNFGPPSFSAPNPLANTLAGRDPEEIRAYFVFDLTGYGGGAPSGTLELELEAYFDFLDPDPSQSFDVRDYAGSITTLTTGTSSATNVSIFDDLGDGDLYGSATVTAADVGSILSITLSSAAIADINAASGGLFALGIDLTTATDGIRFGNSGEVRTHRLDLVPEPTTALLFTAGLVGMGMQRRRCT
jgi:hypothetical protein